MKSYFDAVLKVLTSALSTVLSTLLPRLLAAWALGYSAWALTHTELLPAVLTNTLAHSERMTCLRFVASALGAASVLLVARAFYRRSRVAKSCPRELAALGLPLTLPLAVTAFTPGIEHTHPTTTVLLILAVAAGCMASLYSVLPRSRPAGVSASLPGRASSTEPASSIELAALAGPSLAEPSLAEPSLAGNGFASAWAKVVRWLASTWRGRTFCAVRALMPATAVLILWGAYSAYFSYLSRLSVEALRTRHWDLSIYNNLLYHSAHGDSLGASLVRGNTHTTAHFDPILIPLAWLYRLHPDLHFLLVVQSLWCGFGSVPAYLLAKQQLRSGWAGVVVAAAYALHPALQGANTNAFHSLTLVATPLLWAWYWAETERYGRFLLMLPIIWAIREDAALLAGFVGASLLTTPRNTKRVATGIAALLLSVGYFLVVKYFFMASADVFMKGKRTYDYTAVFSYMIPNGRGMQDYLLTLLTNPVASLLYAFSEAKLAYIFKMLGPFLFVPLLARRGRVVLLYGLLFLLLATKRSVCGTVAQYGMVTFPFLVGLLPSGVNVISRSRWLPAQFGPKQRRWLLLVGILLASVLCACKFGALAQNQVLTTLPAVFDAEMQQRRDVIRALVRRIPEHASVAASGTLLPFVSNRMEVYVLERHAVKPPAPPDYYFLTEVGLSAAKFKEAKNLFVDRENYELIADKLKVRLYRRIAGASSQD